MKETLKYYYNIETNNLEEKNGQYHFNYKGKDYFFVFYNRLENELKDIIFCNEEMKNKNIDCHVMIKNIKNSFITQIKNHNYILMGVNNPLQIYDLFEINNFNKNMILNFNYSNLYRNNWVKLWSNKVDYFEKQVRELALNKKIIINSISYYLGLAENAISLVNIANKKYKDDKSNIVLSHRRIFYPNIKLNFLNPLSFVFDLKIRDIAEYLKSMFFSSNEIDTFIELSSYLKIANLNIYELNMFWARLLYPTYYFDKYEEIMNDNQDEEILIKIIDKVDDYENFLKKTYLELSKYGNIEKIEWLIN